MYGLKLQLYIYKDVDTAQTDSNPESHAGRGTFNL